MEREIKFRAWDKDSKKMFEDVGLTPTECIVYKHSNKMILPKEDWRFGRDTIAVMQYTGLQDKNGKDIYEEDVVCDIDGFKLIVNYLVNYKLRIGQNESDGTVYYSFITGYMGKFKDGSGYTTLDEVLEVIGNVYENPELLQSKNS